ncbi:MAG TPA: YlxR family protein [Anaerolineae bacterium]|nr:YlxR family protein [Anaerolineae bacterium]
MCVVCRTKTDKRDLIRIVRTQDKQLLVDPTGKQNGRGAYVCHQSKCWHIVCQGHLIEKVLAMTLTEADKQHLIANQPQ